MHCPFCFAEDTKVIDSRLNDDGQQVRRRRVCVACAERFTTYETAELTMPRVIKQDGSRQSFHDQKIRDGIARSCEKRSITTDCLEQTLRKIKARVRALGEKEVSSVNIGHFVMEELLHLDHVAYVRFASVYRAFEDISQFGDMIATLSEKTHVPSNTKE